MSLDTAYQSQRRRIAVAVSAHVRAAYTVITSREEVVAHAVPIVEAGQRQTAALVDAYIAAKITAAVGDGRVGSIDPARYTIAALRGGNVTAADVYTRPFTTLDAALARGDAPEAAHAAVRAAAEKLAFTDIQLAQTHAARDVMVAEPRIVGYRRVLSGPGPHCKLCELASTRTYKTSDLAAIHEHCTCGVQPLFGTEAVASLGTTVRIDDDPELGPRLMADTWSPVGPRIQLA